MIDPKAPEQPDTEADPSTAEGNPFSPDFEPDCDEEKLIKPNDADIDTDGG
ncbi:MULTISPECIES: hypothetical protein [Pseudomonas]|uniref:Uncharacterized protein n=1 Tax=Pseudomonas quercus TaxID=2722792 RepID=A0ABX0YB82_9PSED|nr:MULTISPECIES: hypothetical protein [Pseudomonas]MBF7141129.1 hypothetical protein [Pseudomonas sp. LY10J]NJO99663.1 hypothetical protein [Pseudomonas quercus]